MTSKEALSNLRWNVSMSQDIDYKESNNCCDIIEKDLEILDIIISWKHLLFKDRKTISKEFDKWCVDNNVLNCSENMTTWFLSIKLKEERKYE